MGTTVADHQAETGNAAQIEFWNSAATRPWADTGTSTGRLMFTVLGSVPDVERDLCGRPGQTVKNFPDYA